MFCIYSLILELLQVFSSVSTCLPHLPRLSPVLLPVCVCFFSQPFVIDVTCVVVTSVINVTEIR